MKESHLNECIFISVLHLHLSQSADAFIQSELPEQLGLRVLLKGTSADF
jgi:hypothetical protein